MMSNVIGLPQTENAPPVAFAAVVPHATGAAAASYRRVALALLVIPAAALLSRALPDDDAVLVAIKLVVATFAIGLVPGMALVLAWRPRSELTLLGFVGLGAAASFGLVQALTMAAMTLHVPTVVTSTATLIASAVALVVLAYRSPPRAALTVERGELGVIVLIAGLAGMLFSMGAIYTTGEDFMHIAVARRLAFLEQPALNNIYFTPNVVYTYPFPGIHYFFAMVSRVNDVDAMFVYHKLRFFWVLPAISYAYMAARLVFGRSAGYAMALTAVLFVASGAFARMFTFWWGQLAPLSHASDVAMSVLLPALLVLALYYFHSEEPRDRALFLTLSLGLIVMLTIVHIREIVQYFVYLVAFSIGALVLARGRVPQRRVLTLIASTLVIAVGYFLWERQVVVHVGEIEAMRKAQLIDIISQRSLGDWIARPFLAKYFSTGFEVIFHGWIPILVLLGPVILWLSPRRGSMLFFATGILAYLLIIRFAFLAIPYTYMTYFEILYVPARNVIFFVHVLAGAFLYLVAVNLARVRRRWVAIALGAALVVALKLSWELGEWVYGVLRERDPWDNWGPELDLFFGPAILLYGAYLLSWTRVFGRWAGLRVKWFPSGAAPSSWLRVKWFPSGAAPSSWLPTFWLIAVPLALWTAVPMNSPVIWVLHGFGGLPRITAVDGATPANLMLQYSCYVADQTVAGQRVGPSCPPSYALVQWMSKEVPANALLATNMFSRQAPPTFIPQQIVAWPIADSGSLYWEELFPDFARFYQQAMDRYGTQPFFNSDESLEERLEFVRALGVTHVLVDPMYHDELTDVLARWPGQFVPRYDDGAWAVYEVKP